MMHSVRLWCVLCLALVGCRQQNYAGPKRFPLSGQVTYDGQPIDFGSISFLPAGSGAQRVSGGIIENGAYSVTEEHGANAGAHRVEIRWRKMTGKKRRDPDSGEMYDDRSEGLPARFHSESELTVEVSGKKPQFDFHLTSK